MIAMIVAVDKNGLIGNKNRLPWHCPEDLKHFYRTIKNHELLMGKRTFDSIRLKDNVVHVVTHQTIKEQDNIRICTDLSAFLKQWQTSEKTLCVCGGASIYQQAFPFCSEAYVSVIDGEYQGDCYLPPMDFSLFQQKQKIPMNGFVLYHFKDRR